MSRRVWCAIALSILAVGLVAFAGFAAQQAIGCVGEWKSYQSCLVAGRNVAHWIFGLQFWSILFLLYFCVPLVLVLVAVEFTLSVFRARKR